MSSTVVSNVATQTGCREAGRVETTTRAVQAESNPFGRLVQLVQVNERLIADLDQLGRRQADARAYLSRSDCNLKLGTALVAFLKAKRSGILCQLRANRIEAEQIVGAPASPRHGAA